MEKETWRWEKTYKTGKKKKKEFILFPNYIYIKSDSSWKIRRVEKSANPCFPHNKDTQEKKLGGETKISKIPQQ